MTVTTSAGGSLGDATPGPVVPHGPATFAPSRVRPKPVTLRRVVLAEWIKLLTVPSTLVVIGFTMVSMVLIALIIAHNTLHLTANLQKNDIAASSTMQGFFLGQLLMGAVGVLYVSSEYGTGMIRSTLVAVPTRLPVLWAKLVVLVGVTMVTMMAACIVAFISAQAYISRYRPGFSLGDPGVARVVLGTGVFLALMAVAGMILGWLTRSTAGGLSAFVGIMLVLPELYRVFGTVGRDIAKVLPGNAGESFITTIPESNFLDPWTGLAVLLAWLVVGTAVAALALRRRDA